MSCECHMSWVVKSYSPDLNEVQSFCGVLMLSPLPPFPLFLSSCSLGNTSVFLSFLELSPQSASLFLVIQQVSNGPCPAVFCSAPWRVTLSEAQTGTNQALLYKEQDEALESFAHRSVRSWLNDLTSAERLRAWQKFCVGWCWLISRGWRGEDSLLPSHSSYPLSPTHELHWAKAVQQCRLDLWGLCFFPDPGWHSVGSFAFMCPRQGASGDQLLETGLRK